MRSGNRRVFVSVLWYSVFTATTRDRDYLSRSVQGLRFIIEKEECLACGSLAVRDGTGVTYVPI